MSYISRDVLTAGQKRYLKVKRAFDVCFALLLLLLLWPLMLLAALWVKLESPGPAIYSQRRPGYHQKIFSIYKFRSMRVETTRNGVPLSDEERVTRSGKILRKTSIDELPQLFNILKGEMSLIGPRPQLINDLETFTGEQLIRFEVLPGITSWTAIHGRNMIAVQEKYDLDVYYVQHIGFKIDAEIFFKTIPVVLSQENTVDLINEQIPASEILSDQKEREPVLK